VKPQHVLSKSSRGAVITRDDIRKMQRQGKLGPGSPLLDLLNNKKTRGHGAKEEEHRGQRFLFEHIRRQCAPDHPLHDAYAIPNRSFGKKQGAELKAEGRKAGMPDVCIPHARWGFHACYLEGKIVGQRVAPVQKQVHARLRAAGNQVIVVYGVDGADLGFNYWDEAMTYIHGNE
jgi:hypothetical protein